jgi:hypothetical protein
MIAARGIITARGGRTSHAAVVARGISRPAVCGVDGLIVSADRARLGSVELAPGEIVSIDGSSGEIYAGAVAMIVPALDARIENFLTSCDARRRIQTLAIGDDAGWVEAPEEIDRATGRRILIDPTGEGAAALLDSAVIAFQDRELVLRVPDPWPPSLREIPAGPWVAVAATDRGRLAARFLAAKMSRPGTAPG